MSLKQTILDTLHAEVKPAMGCTEPVAVALAVAKAKEVCLSANGHDLDEIELTIKVSPNIFKNGLSVGIPGTDQVGLIVASALGLLACESKDGLEVFRHVVQSDIANAFKLIDEKRIKIEILDTDLKVLIDAYVTCGAYWGKAVIQDRHDQFVLIESHDGVMFKTEVGQTCSCDDNVLFEMPLSEIIQAIETIDFEDLAFLLEGYEMNRAMAEYGLVNESGMNVGRALYDNTKKGILMPDLMNRAMILTAAASDARMSGASLPVMSSNGSGNNGLTALLPIVAYADTNPTSPENLAKAAAISHLVNSVVKHNIGRLSALCGCGVAAGTGASVAITWLMGGTYAQIEGAIQNMIANTTGMICDGAKVGCSLKLATSASAAIQSSLLSMSNVIVPSGNGVIGKTAEDSIRNLGYLSKHAMGLVDKMVLNVMMEGKIV